MLYDADYRITQMETFRKERKAPSLSYCAAGRGSVPASKAKPPAVHGSQGADIIFCSSVPGNYAQNVTSRHSPCSSSGMAAAV